MALKYPILILFKNLKNESHPITHTKKHPKHKIKFRTKLLLAKTLKRDFSDYLVISSSICTVCHGSLRGICCLLSAFDDKRYSLSKM